MPNDAGQSVSHPLDEKERARQSQAPLRGGNLTIINHRLCLWLAPVPPGYIPGRVYPIARRMVYQPHRFHGQALKGLSYRITRKRAYRFPNAHLVICAILLKQIPYVLPDGSPLPSHRTHRISPAPEVPVTIPAIGTSQKRCYFNAIPATRHHSHIGTWGSRISYPT